MKLGISNNAQLVILAHKDYPQALRVAERMVENSNGAIEIAAVEQDEFVHLCSVWSHFQRQEMRDEYFVAKRSQ